MGQTIRIDQLADTVMRGLTEYAELSNTAMKEAVRKTGKKVRSEIAKNAPRRTGAYKKSWRVQETGEDAHTLTAVVHSRDRYQLTHLLEFGHAKRGGGRVAAIPHIAPEEQEGVEMLEREIRKALEG